MRPESKLQLHLEITNYLLGFVSGTQLVWALSMGTQLELINQIIIVYGSGFE